MDRGNEIFIIESSCLHNSQFYCRYVSIKFPFSLNKFAL